MTAAEKLHFYFFDELCLKPVISGFYHTREKVPSWQQQLLFTAL